MTGKTHTSIGIFTSLIIAHPTDLKSIVLCAMTASVGAVICDVDVKSSSAHSKLYQVIGIMGAAIGLATLANFALHINIFEFVTNNSSITRILIGLVALIGICIWGSNTPHRSFMHSLLGLAVINIIVYTISPILSAFFLPAMISHIAIDMLNRKKVGLFYPKKGGVALNACKSDGLVNNVMFMVASLGCITYLTVLFFNSTIKNLF